MWCTRHVTAQMAATAHVTGHASREQSHLPPQACSPPVRCEVTDGWFYQMWVYFIILRNSLIYSIIRI